MIFATRTQRPLWTVGDVHMLQVLHPQTQDVDDDFHTNTCTKCVCVVVLRPRAETPPLRSSGESEKCRAQIMKAAFISGNLTSKMTESAESSGLFPLEVQQGEGPPQFLVGRPSSRTLTTFFFFSCGYFSSVWFYVLTNLYFFAENNLFDFFPVVSQWKKIK